MAKQLPTSHSTPTPTPSAPAAPAADGIERFAALPKGYQGLVPHGARYTACMDGPRAEAIAAVRIALFERRARLANGTLVDTPLEAIYWLIENAVAVPS